MHRESHEHERVQAVPLVQKYTLRMADHDNERPRVDGRSTRWAGQHQRRRAQFVDAAIAAIARHGPDISTEQIAAQAGVARTRLYKHFVDAADLNHSITQKAIELIVRELEPVWNPAGTPMDVISAGVGSYLRWLVKHRNLYYFLSRHSLTRSGDSIRDIRATISSYLAGLFETYLTAFGLDTRVAEPLGFGIIGLVESATSQWLHQSTRMSGDELTEELVRWIWRMIDDTLRARGIQLDPYAPLPSPEAVSADTTSYTNDPA